MIEQDLQPGAMPDEANPVVVHYHIFKNAGTSIDIALRQYFGNRWAEFEGDHAHDLKTSAHLREFLRHNPNIQAVSSHLARPPTPHSNTIPIIFLRRPLARARSVYEFTRRDPSQPFREATAGTFSEYLEWALSGGPGSVVIRNYQVIHLSSASFTYRNILDARATEGNLSEAISLLESCPALGVVEKYERSLQVIERTLHSVFPELTLANVHANRSDAAPSDEEKIKLEIGDSLYREFNRQNRLDNDLYRYAADRLETLYRNMN
jgi:hypothetical protein